MRCSCGTIVTLLCLKFGSSKTLTATSFPKTSLEVKRRSITFSVRVAAVIKRILRLPLNLWLICTQYFFYNKAENVIENPI